MIPIRSTSSSPARHSPGDGGSSSSIPEFGSARFSKSQFKNQKSKIFATFFLFPFSFFLLALLAAAQSTDDSSTTPDFSSFQVIVDGNIFNPDRYGRHYVPPQIRRSNPTFSLAGTMSYRKGMFAFFDGTSEEYRKALQQGGTIAGYTVKKIDFDGVQLLSSGKTIEMQVGAAMRLEEGAWELSAPGDWGEVTAAESGSGSGTAQETSETSTNNAPSSGDENDVLKRLMEKRKQQEQELK